MNITPSTEDIMTVLRHLADVKASAENPPKWPGYGPFRSLRDVAGALDPAHLDIPAGLWQVYPRFHIATRSDMAGSLPPVPEDDLQYWTDEPCYPCGVVRVAMLDGLIANHDHGSGAYDVNLSITIEGEKVLDGRLDYVPGRRPTYLGESTTLTTARAAEMAGMTSQQIRNLVSDARRRHDVELQLPREQWPDARTPLYDAGALRRYLAER